MPDFVGLPEGWKQQPQDDGYDKDTIAWEGGRRDPQADFKALREWVKNSEWAGYRVLDFNYATTPAGDWEYKWPYYLQLTVDKKYALQEVNLDPPILTLDEKSTLCAACYRWGIPLIFGKRAGTSNVRMYCEGCNPVCTGCGKGNDVGTKIRTGDKSPGPRGKHLSEANTLCFACRPTCKCLGCQSVIHEDSEFLTEVTYQGKKHKACVSCIERYTCKTCRSWGNVREGGKACNECYIKQFDKIVNTEPKFAVGMLPKGGLSFPNLPQRPYRTVSIETEMDGDPDALSGVLYACGIIQNPRVESYHSFPDHSAEWLCHLKFDGTATAGELISHLLDLSSKDHADGLVNMLRRLYGLEKLGLINYSSGCGGHIHIDAHNYDWSDVYRLFTIFGYVEDVIYRLAGAGSHFGHRSLDKGARTANDVEVGSYSQPIRKGPFGSLENFKIAIKGEDRGKALNLQPYLQAIGNCRCPEGRHGKLKFCKCNLGKATIEWRIWNATGNPRILHAWIAIMQAMHAYCEGEGEPSDEWLQQYPVFPYTGKKWINNTQAHKDTAKQRLEWMLREFVFTPEERKSIIYTVQQSEMGDMFNLRERNMYQKMAAQDLPPKIAPRNPVRRERNVVIKARTPDEIKRVKAGPLGMGR